MAAVGEHKILPDSSDFVYYKVNNAYIIINKKNSYWTKATKYQMLAIEFFDGKTNIDNILEKISAKYPNPIGHVLCRFVERIFNEYPKEVVKLKRESKIKQLYINLVNHCNSNCLYCFRGSGKKNHKELSSDLFYRIVTRFEKGLSNNAEIVFTGGEPTLHPYLLEFASYTKKKGYFNTLQTNGILLDKYKIHDLKLNFDLVQISLDSTQSAINDYLRGFKGHCSKVMRFCEVNKPNLPIQISSTITKENISSLKEINTNFSDFSVKFTPVLEIGQSDLSSKLQINSEEYINALSESEIESVLINEANIPKIGTKKSICGAAKSVFSIDVDGIVYPCQSLHSDELKCGDINSNSSIEEIINKSIIIKKLDELSTYDISECNNCDLEYICGGGCRANSYWKYGDLEHQDPNCNILKVTCLNTINSMFEKKDI